jgi:hypothetical protein
MNKRCFKPMPVLLTISSVAVAFTLSASDLKGEEILLKYKATVVEETKDYIVIKFQKRDVGLITERGKATETLPDPLSPDKSPLTPGPSGQSLSRAELKREILQELRGEIQKEVTKGTGLIEYGSVEGRIVRRGAGEPEVRVKLVRWVEEASVLGVFKELKKGAEFEATTDQEGRYAFQEIPVGSYQLKWLPRGGDAWVRRLTEKPDITVRKGAIVTARTVELSKPVLP